MRKLEPEKVKKIREDLLKEIESPQFAHHLDFDFDFETDFDPEHKFRYKEKHNYAYHWIERANLRYKVMTMEFAALPGFVFSKDEQKKMKWSLKVQWWYCDKCNTGIYAPYQRIRCDGDYDRDIYDSAKDGIALNARLNANGRMACPFCKSNCQDIFYLEETVNPMDDDALPTRVRNHSGRAIYLAWNKEVLSDNHIDRYNRWCTSRLIAALAKDLNREKLDIEEETERQILAADVPVTEEASLNLTEIIKSDTECLQSYIFHLIQLENNIYTLKKRLPDLRYAQKINRETIAMSAECRAENAKSNLLSFAEALKAAEEAHKRAEDAVNALQSSGVPHAQYSLVPHPVRPKEPVLEKAGLFNKKKVLAQNEALTAAYQAALKAYEAECRRCDEENSRRRKAAEEEAAKRWQLDIEAARQKADAAKAELDKAKAARAEAEQRVAAEIENAKKLPTPASEAQVLLDKDVAETEELLKKTFAARNELYACGVIFEKYRDVVALSSFYEYLMSGRCTKLEGPDGAYNLYESEIRANRVIAQLDQVIDSLEQIKQNQYMMYSAMKQIGSELEQLNSTMSKALSAVYSIESNTATTAKNTAQIAANSDTIAQNSSVIAHNTAATAFYAKKNAELTNAMGYLVALK